MFDLQRKSIRYAFTHSNVSLVAVMRWPEPLALRRLADDMKTITRNVGAKGVAVLPSENPGILPFFLDHLEGIERKDGTPLPGSIDEHREFFKSHPDLNVHNAVVLQGMMSASAPAENDDADDSDGGFTLADLLRDSREIEIIEWSPETRQTEVVRIKHYMTPASADQARQLREATHMIQARGRGGKQTYEYDSAAYVRLYASRIQRLEGAVISGDPCTQANREEWAKLVPYPWIFEVMTQERTGAEAANPT